ncbi:MAG: YgiQ family radical SAM protein, partial [Methanomassiliicoccaceae archaeon]|nr:YgiQ family radical SAM protein [Methanomassiliicoccaceae archaeon]
GEDITRLGEPELFWSVTAGSVDSMVANYTPTNKRRGDDDLTPGGASGRRPDRACIAYSNLIKRHAKGRPIALGGIEASLRRVAHYDAWSDSVRRSVLFDAKADIITYGMAELSNLELAERLRDGEGHDGIRGTCRIAKEPPPGFLEMPPYEECAADKRGFIKAFRMFHENTDPVTSKGLCQGHGDRFLVQEPPSRPLTTEELDLVHSLGYEHAVHPYCLKDGAVRAMDTIRNSITTHRGCYGECSFCAISAHQGRAVVSRSEDSIVAEAERIASRPGFDGVIRDVGGPTANMYGIECAKKLSKGACTDRRCLFPRPCPRLPIDHTRQISLLERLSRVPGVRKVVVASGIRHDMVVSDRAKGREYVDRIVGSHVSGQLKVAPEHSVPHVLELMGKPGPEALIEFKRMFDESNARQGRDQYLTYYLMAAHPGCYQEDMEELGRFAQKELGAVPEQVQIFTPTPSTVSAMMYHTRRDYADTRDLKSEHSMQMKQRQKDAVTGRGRPGDGGKRRKAV